MLTGYSYGDIYTLSPIIATLYAMISKVQTFNFKKYQNPNDSFIEEVPTDTLTRIS